MDLQAMRAEIDGIDAQLTALYCRRMEVVERIGAYKRAHGLPVRDPQREEELLRRVETLAKDAYRNGARAVFEAILAQSRALQEAPR